MRRLFAVVLVAGGLGCSLPPPASQLPNAQAAIDRMRATTARGTGVQAEAVFDDFGKGKANLTLIASKPARVRITAVNFIVGEVGTLTSDGTQFTFSDLRNRRFVVGRPNACNIARLTQVPVPANVLVDLLRGQAPVLRHDATTPPMAISWDGGGYYVVKIESTRDAHEEIHLAPHPDDFGKPWTDQRLRVLDVQVWQKGVLLYHAQLAGHEPAPMAQGIPGGELSPLDRALGMTTPDPPIPPSGPFYDGEVPRRIRVSVPALNQDVLFRYDKVTWNPPLRDGTFTQPPPQGMQTVQMTCDDEN